MKELNYVKINEKDFATEEGAKAFLKRIKEWKEDDGNIDFFVCDEPRTLPISFDDYRGKILSVINVPAVYEGKVIQVLIYTNDPTRIRGILKEKIMPFRGRTKKREFEILKGIFRKNGLVFSNEISYNSKEKPLKTWFNELISHPANEKILGKEYFNKSLLNRFDLFKKNEAFNPSSKFYLNWEMIFPRLDTILNFIIRYSCVNYVVITGVSKLIKVKQHDKNEDLDMKASNELISLLYSIYNEYSIDGIEMKSKHKKEIAIVESLKKSDFLEDMYFFHEILIEQVIQSAQTAQSNVIDFVQQNIG